MSDSESEDNVRPKTSTPTAREEILHHRSLQEDRNGRTHIVVSQLLVPGVSEQKTGPGARFAGARWATGFGICSGGGGRHPLEPARRKEHESEHPMAQWRNGRHDRFLDELIRLKSRGEFRNQTKCANCPRTSGHDLVYRCKDCFTDALFCQECLVSSHRDNPLHRVEAWTESSFFQAVTLKLLGLRIQLGHGCNGTYTGTVARLAREAAAAQAVGPSSLPASPSESAGPAPLAREGFCIVDVNGVHEVTVDFCSCSLAEAHDIQLLRARLYPATITNPATAATFRVLRDYHLLCFEVKASAYHYYNKLGRQTNNNEFRRMTRQWHNLQMFKRAGRGHAADGIAGKKPGECALLCPACPQPGKNLPVDGSWRNVPRERRFLYALFLAIDANFRMKRDVSSEEEDPSLADGVAFFTRVEEYMQHLEKHWNLEQEKAPASRMMRWTSPTERHGGWHPPEYINMDFMLWKSLEHHDDIVQLYISYDIVCQWHKNVWQRLAEYAPPAGNEACNILFSFNLTPFVAQTDGEAPERGWANDGEGIERWWGASVSGADAAGADATVDLVDSWAHEPLEAQAFIATHGLKAFRERTEREKSRQMALEREKWVEAQQAANQRARELREAAQ
ncbi:hypothetical protein B0H14DRAFT_3485279 [Mycena olivaceomarginata]|nr:hypothetical protein B0H14DRAFT_3485279 [Mycena olivaceomarginata]